MSRRTRIRPKPFTARHHRAAETRAAILGAAEGIFAESGFGGARTDAIAERAGVNKALLYYYFKSKDALYHAILEDHLKDFRHQILEVLCGEGQAGEKVLAYVVAHFAFISSHPSYPRLLQRLVMAGGKSLERVGREGFAPVYRKLASVIEEGIRNGEFRQVDSRHAALSLVALIVFYFTAAPMLSAVTHFDPYEKHHLKQRKEEVLKFVRHALFRNRKETDS